MKILDNELFCEEPHVTIVFKKELWRLGLRSQTFFDEDPKPEKVPQELMEVIRANFNTLRNEWDTRFPTNPISHDDDEDEEEE